MLTSFLCSCDNVLTQSSLFSTSNSNTHADKTKTEHWLFSLHDTKKPAVWNIVWLWASQHTRSRSTSERLQPKELLSLWNWEAVSNFSFIADSLTCILLPRNCRDKRILNNCPSDARAVSLLLSYLITEQPNRFTTCSQWHMAGRLSVIMR